MREVKSFNKRLESLRSERSTFIPIYGELSDYHLAHRGRFLSTDVNKGHKRNTKQINNASHLASRTLASGMMSGITSPSKPWFRLGTDDVELREFAPVKQYLHQVQRTMYKVFAQSNTYNSLHTTYAELGVFATAAMGIYPNFKNVIHCRPYTAGSYMLAMNGDNEVDTFYYEHQITVAQCIKLFGKDNVSDPVKRQWDHGDTEAWVPIVHVIEPNDDRDMMSPLARDMPFRSVYYEKGSQTSQANKFLRQSGFREFSIVGPRWDVTAEDVYGTDCPGMTALGDTKSLQLAERRSAQALDKIVSPPLQGPAGMRNKVGRSLRPNEIVYSDSNGQGLKSIYENFRPDIAAIEGKISRTEQRISRAFYEDLFLMLANDSRSNVTAREIAEKHEEKLLMLGPVLERLHTEMLDPLIDITFSKLQEAGVLPVPPPELRDTNLKVDYVSVLAQAQRLVGIGALDRVSGFVGSLTQVWPEARHKFDPLQAVDEYADGLGVSPKVIVSDDVVGQRVAAEQAAAAQQAKMEQAASIADTVKTASDISMGEDTPVGELMRQNGLA